MARTIDDDERPPRWQAVTLSLAVGTVLAVFAIWIYTDAETRWEGVALPPHGTAFPYLASAVVFVVACIWVTMETHATMVAAVGRTSIWRCRWAALCGCLVFLVVFAILAKANMAGPAGKRAALYMNCFLFGSPKTGCPSEPCEQIFNYLAAAGIAMSFSTMTYLGLKCRELTESAGQARARGRPIALRSWGRALSGLLVLASTVLVTALLSLYLSFVTSAELSASPFVETSVRGNTSGADRDPRTTTLHCNALIGPTPLECVLDTPPAANAPKAVAPTMAFVAGLSFTGALFFLFMTAAAALEDVTEREMQLARARSKAPDDFDASRWLEQQGLTEGARDPVFRALALLAPAATGAITFFTG